MPFLCDLPRVVMKDFYIADCPRCENKVITSSFVVAAKQVKPKKTGEPYLALTLADRSGQVEAKMWDNVAEAIDTFEQDDYIKVKGLINRYKNHFQLTIHKLRKLTESEVDFADYLPKTSQDVEQLWQVIADYVAGFKNEYLRALVQAFMADPEIAAGYKNAPAAKTLHHAYIGGLLEHVVSLFRSCDLVSRNYPQIDRDLLLTGAFLHDIGKIYELSYNRSFSYTTRGQLLGHMIIELEMLQEKIAQVPGFPTELKILLEHLIISHHGEYEFGSPKLPMFPEALMLHYMDDLDSKMESMRAHFEREAGLEGAWTGYNPSLGRPLLKRDKFVEKPAAAEAPAPPELDAEGKTPPLPGFEPANGHSGKAAAAAAGPATSSEPEKLAGPSQK
ncbi:MAG TPA: OB-fold nucleic acid binding domain-containing protein [Terriglobales bacterium]|nr:OB-fold nucleic acid binding domain-containing protein [Terriglobales bacterium]